LKSRSAGEITVLAALVPLNVIFLWTSGAYAWMPALNPVFLQISELFLPGRIHTLTEFDAVPLALWAAVVAGSWLWFSGRGTVVGALRTLQVSFLSLIPLPVEIYLVDVLSKGGTFAAAQFNIAVTAAQVTSGVLPWFTNADLLYTSVAIVMISTVSLFFFQGRPSRA
jgi:hypothetical protein